MSAHGRRPPSGLAGGILRLMLFDPSGLAAIGGTRQAFMASLAPMLGFLLVGAVLEALGAGWRNGVADGLQTLCVVLGQPVISHAVAARWGRGGRWPRYATAMNWCHVAMPIAGAALLSLIVLAGGSSGLMAAVLGAIFVYALLLDWFVARQGLDLSPWRAAGLLCISALIMALLLAVPVAWRLQALGRAALGSGGIIT